MIKIFGRKESLSLSWESYFVYPLKSILDIEIELKQRILKL